MQWASPTRWQQRSLWRTVELRCERYGIVWGASPKSADYISRTFRLLYCATRCISQAIVRCTRRASVQIDVAWPHCQIDVDNEAMQHHSASGSATQPVCTSFK